MLIKFTFDLYAYTGPKLTLLYYRYSIQCILNMYTYIYILISNPNKWVLVILYNFNHGLL